MVLISPINLRSPTVSIVNEGVAIPAFAPHESRLVEVPTAGDKVQIRRITSTVKTGAGSGSILSLGFYAGMATRNYKIQIDKAGDIGTATFKWSNNEGLTWQGTEVPIGDADPIELELGVQIQAAAGAGQDFDLNDYWTFDAEFWIEVATVPIITKAYQVNYANGLIMFHSTNAGSVVYATYQGRGSVVKAEDIIQLIDYLRSGKCVLGGIDTSTLTTRKFVAATSGGGYQIADNIDDERPAIGCVEVVDDSRGSVVLFGPLGGFAGLVAGTDYFLSTSGGYTLVQPLVNPQVVGRAVSSTVMFINPIQKSVPNEAVILAGVNTTQLNVGEWVGVLGDSWAKASASWADLLPAVGVVKKSAGNGKIVLSGIMDGFSGLTPGVRYYLSNVAGTITTTPPSDPNIRQVVGRALTATRMLVSIADDW